MKVPGSKILSEYEDVIVKQALPEIFVTIGQDGDDAYRNTYDSKVDAVDCGCHTGQLVLTYKLVRVEELALERSTKVVAVKIPSP